MRLNTTGIAARMMLSLDKKAIGEKLINGRQINPTPLQVRYQNTGKGHRHAAVVAVQHR